MTNATYTHDGLNDFAVDLHAFIENNLGTQYRIRPVLVNKGPLKPSAYQLVLVKSCRIRCEYTEVSERFDACDIIRIDVVDGVPSLERIEYRR